MDIFRDKVDAFGAISFICSSKYCLWTKINKITINETTLCCFCKRTFRYFGDFYVILLSASLRYGMFTGAGVSSIGLPIAPLGVSFFYLLHRHVFPMFNGAGHVFPTFNASDPKRRAKYGYNIRPAAWVHGA